MGDKGGCSNGGNDGDRQVYDCSGGPGGDKMMIIVNAMTAKEGRAVLR